MGEMIFEQKKIKLDLHFTGNSKINSKWIKESILKDNSLNYLKENVQKKIHVYY